MFLPPVHPPPAPQSSVNLRDARKDNPPSPFVLEHAAIAPGTEHLRGFTPASWQGFWTRGASRGRRRRIERPEGRRDFPGPAAPRGSEAGAEPSCCAVPHATMVLRALGAGTEDPELRALSSRRGLDPDAHCRAAPVASMPRFPGARVGSTSVKAQEPSRAGGPFGLVLSCFVQDDLEPRRNAAAKKDPAPEPVTKCLLSLPHIFTCPFRQKLTKKLSRVAR